MDFEATVSGLSAQGSGIVEAPTGGKFFVSGAWPGDRGRFAVRRAQGNYGEAVSLGVERLSPEREAVPCAHHGVGPSQCGGCPWLGVPYGRQLEEKHRMVSRLLKRYGIETPVQPVAASERTWGYRNRVQLKTDGERMGYVSPSSRALAPIEGCGVLEPDLQGQLEELARGLPRSDWRPSEGFSWNFFELESGRSAGDVVLNRRLPFRQGNDSQNASMGHWLSERLRCLSGPVLELFCGSGNLTRQGDGRPWTAVEANAAGLAQLEQAQLPGVTPVRADCYQRSSWRRFASPEIEGLLLDPPRQGFGALSSLVSRLPGLDWIVYVSCQPSSWVRDVGPLRKKGWKVAQVQPLDFFPQTPHVELLTVLRRQRPNAV